MFNQITALQLVAQYNAPPKKPGEHVANQGILILNFHENNSFTKEESLQRILHNFTIF